MNGLLLVPPAVVVAVVAVAVYVLGRLPDRRVGHVTAVAGFCGLLAWMLLVPSGIGLRVTYLEFELVVLVVDEVSRFVGLVFGGFGLLSVVFAANQGVDRRRIVVAIGCVAASLGVVFAGDWLTLAISWILFVGFVSVLVGLAGGRAVRAGYGFVLVHAAGAGSLLAGVAFHANTSGTPVRYVPITDAGIASGLPAAAVGLAVGVGVGAVGLHVWMAETFSAPHVSTAVFLCGFTTPTAAVIAHRAFPQGELLLAYVGGVMVIFGAVVGLLQWNIRRLLAYQLQAQVGVVLVGVGVGSSVGIAGGFLHLLTTVGGLGLAFVVAGWIAIGTVDERIDRVPTVRADRSAGTPWSILTGAIALAVVALSLAGVPGFVGFVSVGLILVAVDGIGAPVLRWSLLAGAAVTVATFAKVLHVGFLSAGRRDARRVDAATAAVIATLVGVCVGLGIHVDFVTHVLPGVVEQSVYSPWRVVESTAVVVVGVVGYLAVRPLLEWTHGDVDRVLVGIAQGGFRRLTDCVARLSGTAAETARVCARTSVRCVREPDRAVITAVPDRWRKRVRSRRERTPGVTGTKLGIEGSIYVFVVLLALGLAVGLR